MKKYFLIAFWSLMLPAALSAQAPPDRKYINQTKYWFYRNRLTNEFLKVGPGTGESLPVQVINYNTHYIHLGDGSVQKVGHYLSILASEYKLLKMNGQNTDRTIEEIYYALNAIRRLDERAEYAYYCVDMSAINERDKVVFDYPNPSDCDGTDNGYSTSTLNGFMLRTDIDPRNGVIPGKDGSIVASENFKYFNNMTGTTHLGSGFAGNIKGFERDIKPNGTYETMREWLNNDISHDQISHLLMGMRLIQVLLDGTETYNPGTGPENIKALAINLTKLILRYMEQGSVYSETHCNYMKNYLTDDDLVSGRELLRIYLNHLGNNSVCQPMFSPFFYGPTRIPWLSNNPVTQQPAALSVSPGGAFPFALSYGYARAGNVLTGESYYYHDIAFKFWKNIAGELVRAHKLNDKQKVLTLAAISNSWDFPCGSIPCRYEGKLFFGLIKVNVPVPGIFCGEILQCPSAQSRLAEHCKLGQLEILPLLYNVIYGKTGFGQYTAFYEDFFQSHIDNAPCRGPYFYSFSDRAAGDWITWNLFAKPEDRTDGAYGPTGILEHPGDLGEYNGMDFMLMYNLYNIYKNNPNPYFVNYADNLNLPLRVIRGTSEYYNARSFRNADGTYNYNNGNITTIDTLIVEQNGYVNFRAGSSINFGDGFHISPGSQMEATIYQPANNWDWEMNICSSFDPNTGIPNGHRMSVQSQNPEQLEEPKPELVNLLGDCYPNPTHHAVKIPYQISAESQVQLSISDMFGKEVATLVKVEKHPVGNFTEEVNTAGLRPGMYYYTLKTKNFSATKKLMIIR